MDRPKIAAVILTKNEERTLGTALKSMAWVDDLVVLDSGSEDRTEEVAKEHGARFVVNVQPPPFDISQQRNYAMNNCDITAPWVLHMDADETVTSELREEILTTIARARVHCVRNF